MEDIVCRVSCLRKEIGHKLVFEVDAEALRELKETVNANKNFHRKICKRICNIMGLWHGTCDRNKTPIKEIELILPPGNEYTFMTDDFKEFLLQKKDIHFSVSFGLQISSTGHDYRTDECDTLIQHLHTGDPRLN